MRITSNHKNLQIEEDETSNGKKYVEDKKTEDLIQESKKTQ